MIVARRGEDADGRRPVFALADGLVKGQAVPTPPACPRSFSCGGRAGSWTGGRPAGRPGAAADPDPARGFSAFCFQYLLQAGLFFVVSLFLSVANCDAGAPTPSPANSIGQVTISGRHRHRARPS
jgi:hypothetical protein